MTDTDKRTIELPAAFHDAARLAEHPPVDALAGMPPDWDPPLPDYDIDPGAPATPMECPECAELVALRARLAATEHERDAARAALLEVSELANGPKLGGTNQITYDWASSIAALAHVAFDVELLRASDTWVRVLGEAGRFPKRVVDFAVSDAPFCADDVVRVIARTDGCAYEYAWIGVFELSDGRFAYVNADIESDDEDGYEEYGHVVGDSFVCLDLDYLVRYVQTRTSRLTNQLPAILPPS